MNKDSVRVECACSTEEFVMSFDAEWWGDADAIILSTKVDAHMAAQDSFLGRWMQRLRWAFTILRGKDFYVQEVVLQNPEPIKDLAIWLREKAATMSENKKAVL